MQLAQCILAQPTTVSLNPMQISELMTKNPTCCTPDTSLQEVAQTMEEQDCGALPILDEDEGKKVIGIITDRDIVTRAVAQGRDPAQTSAREVMTETPVTVTLNDDAENATELMGTNQIRRLVVLDGSSCAGIVAQADLTRHLPAQQVSNTLERISQPSSAASGPSAAARNA